MTSSYYTQKETSFKKLQEDRLPQNFNDNQNSDQNQANYYSFVVAWQMFNDFEKPEVSGSGGKTHNKKVF